MSTNNTFSFARLALVMKRDFMENWKTNLYRFLGPYAVILFVMLMGYMKISVNFAEFSSVIAGIFSPILFIGSTFMAAHMMETMDTQQKRISYLMLPATSLEKFISRALHVTVGFWVMTILALLLAEATRFLFLPLFDLPEAFHQSTLPGVLARLDILADSSDMTISNTWPEKQNYSILWGQICSLLYMGWMHSFFILGGCHWQKHPFWKTLGILIIAHILILAVFINALVQLMENNWEMYHDQLEPIFGNVSINQSLTFFSVLLAMLIILNWWLSYRCFTRQQVIKPKFRLL